MLREKNTRKTDTQSASSNYKLIFTWCIAALFTIFQLFLEMLTNIIAEPLMQSFNINHMCVGLLSSTFFYTFLLMQFFVGYMFDRFNIRWALTIGCGGCSLACFLFSHSHSLYQAFISRAIMGGFAAFGFIGLLKITSILFNKRFSLLVGFSQSLVMTCTAFGQSFVNYYVKLHGWRDFFLLASYVGSIITLLIWVFINIDSRKSESSISHALRAIRIIITSKDHWLRSLYGFGMFSFITSFSALWGLPYLTHVCHLTIDEASFGISLTFIGIALGCCFFGIISHKAASQLRIIRHSAVCLLLLVVVMIYSSPIISQLYTILIAIGFFSGAFYLCFDLVKQLSSPESESLSIAFCNTVVMAGTVLLQPFIGLMIDIYKYFTNIKLAQGNGYSIIIYVIFSVILITTFVSFYIKEFSHN